MAGSSVAAPTAAAWVTDFLDAAYYARPADTRDVADLRLAHGILTTRWIAVGRRLDARDVLALHRAFGGARLRNRGLLDRAALLTGARRLLGDWFPAAWEDPARRAHGAAFATAAERAAFDPGRRLQHAALGELTPPLAPAQWSTYPPVALPDADAALAFLADPARWPDMGSAAGRFTALRPGGLPGQTFEIEVVADPAPRLPVHTRGYVTCTTCITTPGAELDAAVGVLTAQVGPLGRPRALIILTTHDGHFLGRALSHLLITEDDGGAAAIRDIGCWDTLPAHLQAAYRAAGRAAQHAFWGPEDPPRSMLAQLALVAR